MKSMARNKNLNLISSLFILVVFCSCGSGNENGHVGKWHLRNIESESNLIKEYETVSEGCNCCIDVTTIDTTTSGVNLTRTDRLCQTIILEESGTGTVISGEEMLRELISYSISSDTIHICYEPKDCLSLIFEKDQLTFDFEVFSATSGELFNETYLYRK